jgi:hypothetical protein
VFQFEHRVAALVTMWTGNMPEAGRVAAMLLEQSNRHSPYFWQLWRRCLEFALTQRDGRAKIPPSLLWDPLCNPLLCESLGTLNEGLLNHEALQERKTAWRAGVPPSCCESKHSPS